VVLVYEECFWQDEQDIYGLLNQPEGKNGSLNQKDYSKDRGRFFLFWNCVQTSGRPVLIALMAGTSAFYAENNDNTTIVNQVTERLKKMFSPKTVPLPSEAIVTRWKRDPFARGTYSYVGPQTAQGDYDEMARPVGNIHFAGEATCASYPATVHGAYISGLRAASEVIDSFLGPIKIPQSPLVPVVKAKTEAPKRKFGYIDVWEPINKPDPFYANMTVDTSEADEYEARIAAVIFEKIGLRPVRPLKAKLNPYIMFCKDEWYRCKAELDQQEIVRTGNVNAKTGRNDVRTKLGAEWKNAPESVKQPYMDRCEEGRKDMEKAEQEYAGLAAEWDGKAAQIRKDFERENSKPESSIRKAKRA
jgi:lysine-specific histone demethylase 1